MCWGSWMTGFVLGMFFIPGVLVAWAWVSERWEQGLDWLIGGVVRVMFWIPGVRRFNDWLWWYRQERAKRRVL